MPIHGFYDAAQDRILLRLDGVSSGGDIALWLTRRQWLAIAMACYRVRAATRQSKPVARTAGKAPAKSQAVVPRAESAETEKADLVCSLKFRSNPSGLRIHIETAEQAPLALTLKGEGLSSFIGLVEGLAARAKWDLSAGLLRLGMGRSDTPQKQVWH